MKINNITKIGLMIILTALIIIPFNVNAQTTNPLIKFNIANYDPMPVQPGQFVDVWVAVQNTGTGDAEQLKIEYVESPYFELVNPEDKIKTIDVLGSYKDYLIKYRFKVADDVVEGKNTLTFEHSLGDATNVVSTTNLNLDVKTTEVPITISSVKLTPDPVEPGQESNLVIAVTNPTQSSNMRDVSLTLQLANFQEGESLELPFAPVSSTNKKSINRIRPGQTTEFKFDLVTYPDATSKIYKLPILFSYYDDSGKSYTETTFVSMNVNSEPDLYAVIENIKVDKTKRSGEVIIDIINQGVSDVKLLSATLKSNENMNVTSASNKEYLGKIETDDFKSANFDIKVNENTNKIILPLTLTFKDALNKDYTKNIEIEYELKDATTNEGSSLTTIIIILIIGIVAFIYYKRRAKRKKLLHDDDWYNIIFF